jgi:hypothetical protein
MSFLDNLESTLKNLEGANEKDTRADQRRRQGERARALAAAPYVDELKNGPFVNDFLTHAVRIGHGSRTRVTPFWVGNIFRAEAKDKRLELRPTADGVLVVFIEGGEEKTSEIIDLKKSDPEKLAARWLAE